MTLKLNLKKLRQNKGLTQQELAEKLHVKQGIISKFESGAKVPSLERSVEISRILGITLDELIEFEEIHHKYSSDMKSKMKK